MPTRILLLAGDPDLGQLLSDYLGTSGFAVIEPCDDSEACSLLEGSGVDAIVAESSRLAASALARLADRYPLIALAEMGERSQPARSARSRTLTKPASLHRIAEALGELSVAPLAGSHSFE